MANPTAPLARLLLSCIGRACELDFIRSELGAGADAMIEIALERKQVRHGRKNGFPVLVWR